MKKNRYIFIVVIVLTLVVVILFLTNSTNTLSRAMSDFAVDDTATVTKIFMSDKNNNTLTLTRRLPGFNWTVNEKYPGQNFNINLLMSTMHNLAVKRTVPLAAHNNIINQLASSSVKVEIYQWVFRINIFGIRLFPREKLTKVYYVGGATPDNQGSFMLMEHSSEPFITYLPGLRGFVSPIYSPIEKYWRDYAIFKKEIHEIASVKVEFTEIPDQSLEIIRNQHGFDFISLIDGRKINDYDTLKIMNFISAFRNLNFEALLNDMDKHRKDSILSSSPFVVISLTDTNNVINSVKIFHKSAASGETDYKGKQLLFDLDRAYALVNGGKDFVLVQFFVFDKVLKPKKSFIKGYKEEQIF